MKTFKKGTDVIKYIKTPRIKWCGSRNRYKII